MLAALLWILIYPLLLTASSSMGTKPKRPFHSQGDIVQRFSKPSQIKCAISQKTTVFFSDHGHHMARTIRD